MQFTVPSPSVQAVQQRCNRVGEKQSAPSDAHSYGLIRALAHCTSSAHLLVNEMVMTHPVDLAPNGDLLSGSCGGDICEDVL